LPSGRITAQELIDAIVRNLPTSQRDPVKRLIEDEIRTLR
jgi:hypothetical protein